MMAHSRLSYQHYHASFRSLTTLLRSVLGLLVLQYSHAQHPHGIHSNPERTCPPDIVASPEEVGHYCHAGKDRHFKVLNDTYECFAMEQQNSICKGKIHPHLELPKCSQGTIADCGDETIYANLNDRSKGPCLYRAEDIVWHSSKCGDHKFQCFDAETEVWCAGSVENDVLLDPPVTCPPYTVYSIHEAAHYCTPSGLSTRMGFFDSSIFGCYWKNGTVACNGRIHPEAVDTPSCSDTIESCNNLAEVCRVDASELLFCSNRNDGSSFECWDKALDHWCVGRIGQTMGTKKPYQPPHKTLDDEWAYHPPHKTRGDEWAWKRWRIASVAVFVAGMTATVGMVLEQKLRPSRYDPTQIVVDRFGYQAVSENMDDLELTPVPQ